MNKVKALSCAALLAGFTNSANAADKNYYAQFNIGSNIISNQDLVGDTQGSPLHGENDYNSEAVYGVAFGTRLTQNFRFELEGRYTDADANGTQVVPGVPTVVVQRPRDINITEGFVNAYYDYRIGGSAFVPFVVAGLGAVYINHVSLDTTHDEEANFAFQVGAGADYELTSNIAASLSYKYVNSPSEFDITTDNASPVNENWEYDSHLVQVGLKYNF